MRTSLRWLLLALPFVGVAAGARLLVPSWARSIARVMVDVTAGPLPLATGAPGGADGLLDAGAGAGAGQVGVPAGAERGAAGSGALDASSPRLGPSPRATRDAGREALDDGGTLALFVPASIVQKTIDEHGKQIRGRTAKNVDGKPIGVRLTGIDAAGVGLHDGDLIVDIDGTPTPDDDVATDAALSAVAKGKSRIHATLLRGARKIDLTLELPETAPEAAASPSAPSRR